MRRWALLAVTAALATTGLASAAAETSSMPPGSVDPLPRWTLEPKWGRFEPDLPNYEQFYGGERSRYLGLAFGYRFTRWLEAGGEVGRSRDTGVGRLPTGELGGRVQYTLYPAQLFVNLRWEPGPRPLLVPYAGISLVRGLYSQRIDLQDGRDGETDLGMGLRLGLQLSLDRLDPGPAAYGQGPLKRTFLFLEAQRLGMDVDDIELGGDVYLLGLRFELGPPRRRH